YRSTGPRTAGLTLGVLGRLTSLLQPVLLALLHPGVPGQEAGLLQRRTVVGLDADQRAGDGQPQRTGLAGDAAAGQAGNDVVLVVLVQRDERLADQLLVHLVREVVLDGAAIELEVSGARHEPDPDDGLLAAAYHWNGASQREFSSVPDPRLLRDLGDRERLRGLGGVRVVRAAVDLQLLQLLAAQRGLGKHALDRDLDQPLGTGLEQLADRALGQPAGVTGVPVAELAELGGRHRDLVGVDDDYEVAGVDVQRELRLVLAAQQLGGGGGQPAQHHVAGVDDMPVPGDVTGLG